MALGTGSGVRTGGGSPGGSSDGGGEVVAGGGSGDRCGVWCGDEEDDVGLAGGVVGRSMTSPPSWAR